MKRTTRPTRPALLLTAAAGAALALLPGCGTKPPAWKAAAEHKETENPWPRVVVQLRKESDTAACRRVLGQLNGDLALAPDPQYQPAGLTPDAEAAARKALRLTDEEAKDLRPAAFTGLDPYYLAECLYLRDAARSLDVGGLPPARQAEVAFAWVCRQVVLQPWVSGAGGQRLLNPPVPPADVLRRGSGSGLERAFVFLALLRQMNLDGCLIGPPEAADRGWAYTASDAPNQPPAGPFWAAGVRAGADILLFDPWRGEPLAGPGGQGVGTLARAKADPGLLKPWAVAPEAVKAAVPFLAVPLSAAAPRFGRLEAELKADSPVRLAVDLAGLRGRFAAETGLPAPAYWNPPADAFSFTRSLAAFVPPADGGMSPAPDLAARYRADQIPRSVFVYPADLYDRPGRPGVPEAVQRLAGLSAGVYAEAFLTGPTPRERIQRGQLFEVTPDLVEKRKFFAAAEARVRADRDRDPAVRDWAAKARDVYDHLFRAREREKADPAGAADARQAVEQFWKQEGAAAGALVEAAVAEPGLAEATYLMAQCMHEQAERAQARYDRAADSRRGSAADPAKARAKAADAWAEAKAWWGQYAEFAAAQDRAFPGRADHARRLADRAARLAAGP